MTPWVQQSRESLDTEPDVLDPINISLSAPENRGVQMFVGPPGYVPSFETTHRTRSVTEPVEANRQPTMPELMGLWTWAQSLPQGQAEQLALLRTFDERLSRLEEMIRLEARSQASLRTSWWALWGLVMLIMLGALVILIILILRENLPALFGG